MIAIIFAVLPVHQALVHMRDAYIDTDTEIERYLSVYALIQSAQYASVRYPYSVVPILRIGKLRYRERLNDFQLEGRSRV